ncbi:pyridine nucleotide-disulfide oxidoreductase [Mycobacterium antarcticum]|uniref:NAD(P)/FAD-dependent oxidoreductase n=1 Tax=Mycolicibacterium sp. TUM20985 TaxID=3023370 RepID=UPI002572AB57|nr:FAD-dependent oxidoreductase [Mycolicibacterium sp. TUM20985]BDX34432.1 pyridine nucleotide-disulfide oxidoreductase [Mycolicibacterium sp. TUM20985]
MSNPGLIVVGSGPAGISAAESYRKHGGSGPVLVLSADGDLPYERPPLSKDFLQGDTDDVALHPAEWFTDRDIDLRHGCPVDAIDTDGHSVTVDGERIPYGALVVALGAGPSPLPVPGGDRALLLRALTDARQLRSAAANATSAVVIGAGFIGCEAAASLAMRGLPVTLVAPDRVPQEKRLGAEAGERLLNLVTSTGVRYVGGASVEAMEGDGVRLDDGVTIACDLVLAATGVSPRSSVAAAAGLQMQDSRIVVGADMRTSATDVYAAGDVTFAFNTVAGRHLAVEHWQDAIDHGTVAGAQAAGAAATWDAVPGFWSTIGDATIKYHAWGDGYDGRRLVDHDDGFTVWYEAGGAAVGVLTYNADDDYDLGETLIAAGRPAPVSTSRDAADRPE